ncbi:MFS transporter [Streptomyces sp. NPDC092296]|uniref:MFS transporter n=1 Tax=Streptomyces sp. NPDC092296 TaxID=3366012 RepID=UPI00381E16A4
MTASAPQTGTRVPPPAAAPDPAEDRAAGPLQAVLLMVGSCLPILGAVLIAPVLPRMQDHFENVSGADALVPMALTIPALSLAILAPFAGTVADRFGRKQLLIGATLVYAVFGTAPLWLDSLGAIVASRALVGVAEAAIMTCCTTLIGDYYSGAARDRYLALQTMCSAVSATLFFALGGALGSGGWRAPFWAYGVSLLIAPLMAHALRRPPQAADQSDASDPAAGERAPFPWRRLAWPCVLTFFGAGVFYTVPVEMSYLLDDLNVTATSAIGLATAIASASTVAGAVTFSRLAAGRPEKLLPGVFGLCAVGFGIMAFAGNTPLLVIGAVVNCFGTGMLLPTLLTRTMALLKFADRGRGTGMWNSAFFLGEFLCPLVLLGAKAGIGSLAHAVGVLGAVTAVVALGMQLRRGRTAQSA